MELNQSELRTLVVRFSILGSELLQLHPSLEDVIEKTRCKFYNAENIWSFRSYRKLFCYVKLRQIFKEFQRNITHVLIDNQNKKRIKQRLMQFYLWFLRPHIIKHHHVKSRPLLIPHAKISMPTKKQEPCVPQVFDDQPDMILRFLSSCCHKTEAEYLTCHFFHVEREDHTLSMNLYTNDLQDLDSVVNRVQTQLEANDVHVTRDMDTPRKDEARNTLTLVFPSQLFMSTYMYTKCNLEDKWCARFAALKKKCKTAPESVRYLTLYNNDTIEGVPKWLKNTKCLSLPGILFPEMLSQIKQLF